MARFYDLSDGKIMVRKFFGFCVEIFVFFFAKFLARVI